jgi:hypothetical protein
MKQAPATIDTLRKWTDGAAALPPSDGLNSCGDNRMALLAPPPRPPTVAVDMADDDRTRRFRMRMTQVLTTSATVVATGWVCTLGAVPAIIALMIAKHVLVAVLMMGLDAQRQRQQRG